MAIKFGTSGLRGLVTEMTPALVARHVQAFLAACETGEGLYVGRDLRASSPRIAQDVITAAQAVGCRVVDCADLPTPALALAAAQAGCGAVMVTGSHIPADRNGLKFYSCRGEVTKRDEAAILACLTKELVVESHQKPLLETDPQASERFVARYVSAFGAHALAGRRIGLYAHSAVGRDVLAALLSGLGAQVVEFGRSEVFIPVDTEAVDAATRVQIAQWVTAQGLDALVSTDGDSDRPLLADEAGRIVPGDVMGQITAQALGAEVVVTPVSSNSGVTRKEFKEVVRTRIGSPFVIAGMEEAEGRVVGYEANGGFLLGFEAQGPKGPLSPLMTRDCMLPLVVTLYAAQGGPLSARVAQEPPVTTLSNRLQDVPQEKSQALLARLTQDPRERTAFLAPLGKTEAALDMTDGLRLTMTDATVVHIRPSGNAPELRVYVEGTDADAAGALLAAALERLDWRVNRPV